MRQRGEKVRCPFCRKDIIVNKKGECPKCKTPLVGDDEIPF